MPLPLTATFMDSGPKGAITGSFRPHRRQGWVRWLATTDDWWGRSGFRARAILTLKRLLCVALVGTWLATLLVAAGFTQAVRYFAKFPNDILFKKTLVGVVLFLLLLGLWMECAEVYLRVVTNWGNPIAFTIVVAVGIPCTFLIGGIVNQFLVHRFYGLLVVLQLFARKIDKTVTLAEFTDQIAPLTSASSGISVVTDFAIAGSLVWTLRGMRTSFKDTNQCIQISFPSHESRRIDATFRHIQHIVALCIQNGCTTSAMSFGSLIAQIVSPTTAIDGFFLNTVGPLYLLTFEPHHPRISPAQPRPVRIRGLPCPPFDYDDWRYVRRLRRLNCSRDITGRRGRREGIRPKGRGPEHRSRMEGIRSKWRAPDRGEDPVSHELSGKCGEKGGGAGLVSYSKYALRSMFSKGERLSSLGDLGDVENTLTFPEKSPPNLECCPRSEKMTGSRTAKPRSGAESERRGLKLAEYRGSQDATGLNQLLKLLAACVVHLPQALRITDVWIHFNVDLHNGLGGGVKRGARTRVGREADQEHTTQASKLKLFLSWLWHFELDSFRVGEWQDETRRSGELESDPTRRCGVKSNPFSEPCHIVGGGQQREDYNKYLLAMIVISHYTGCKLLSSVEVSRQRFARQNDPSWGEVDSDLDLRTRWLGSIAQHGNLKYRIGLGS
ncbi:hypothetical protein C8R46DRAFT_1185042 [Mycena filopes]|nr:hypothetical protein C8R46DRAFT_1185042 [Mycena filopes]